MTETTQRYLLALEIGEEAAQMGKWQQALTCFQTALTGLPHEPRVFNGLGDTHQAMADPARALACYKEAARLGGNTPVYINKVAAIQEKLGLAAEAASSRLLAGDIYWDHQQVEEAKAQWEAAVRLQEDLLAAHERLAIAGKQRGDAEAASRHYLALAEKLLREGRCLMALHICSSALVEFPDAQSVWPITEEAWRCVAARDQRSGQHEPRVETGDLISAGADFAQWQLTAIIHQSTLALNNTINPEAYAHLRQAILHEGSGRAGVAIASYEQAIAAGITDPAIFFVLGLLYRLVGRHEDARAALLLASRHPFYERVVSLLE
ncbi:MAG: tetratricopeptide repeat protein [Candidatus Promineofilum sp.]|nr:tetratricopeptide repeat protein [Promineifilum sp.]